MTDAAPRQTGALQGFVAPFRGFGTLIVRPSLWPWASVPTIVFVTFAIGASSFAKGLFARAEGATARVLGHGALGTAGGALAGLAAALAFIVVSLIVALWIVPPLCAPFMDALASRVDRHPGRDEPLGAQVARSLRVVFAGLLFVGVPQLILAAISLVVSPLAPVCIAIAAGLGALGLAYDALDWPLSRRGLDVGARIAWMRSHAAATVGLGLSVLVISLVPGLVLFALPAIVVGAVRLVNDTEA